MNGSEQLDLRVFEVVGVSWWQHPVVIIALIMIFIVLAAGIALLLRRLRQPRQQLTPQMVAQHLLDDVRNRFETRQITGAQAVWAVTSLLKAYFAAFLQQPEIRAMTDQQWLALLKTQGGDEGIFADCQSVVQVALLVKFNYASVSSEEITRLLDCARRTIDCTSPVKK